VEGAAQNIFKQGKARKEGQRIDKAPTAGGQSPGTRGKNEAPARKRITITDWQGKVLEAKKEKVWGHADMIANVVNQIIRERQPQNCKHLADPENAFRTTQAVRGVDSHTSWWRAVHQ